MHRCLSWTKTTFDTVNCQILIEKLEDIDIKDMALQLLTFSLTRWRQRTLVGNTNSDYVDVKCGVPQGTSLGPILFLIYVNDIFRKSDVSDIFYCSDETTIWSIQSDRHGIMWNENVA